MNESEKMISEEKLTFEECLNKTGFGLYSYMITGLVGLIIMAMVCISYGSAIIIPTSACDLQTTSYQKGILAAMPVAGLTIGGAFWGYLADMYGRRRMLLISLISAATVNIAASLSVNWIMLMVLQFIATVLSSGQYSLSMTIVSESVPFKKRNAVILIATSIFQISQGFMAIFAIPIAPLSFSYYIPMLDIHWNSWRTLVVIYSIPSALGAIWMYFMYESPKFLFMRKKETEATEILRRIHKINGGSSDFEVNRVLLKGNKESSGATSARRQIFPIFKQPLLKTTIILTALHIFQTVSAFKIWLPTIANQFMKIYEERDGINLTLCDIIRLSHNMPKNINGNPCSLNTIAMIIVVIVSAVHCVCNILLSFVIGRIGRRNLAITITGFCGFCGLLVNLIPNAIGSAIAFFIFLMGMLSLGIYTAMSVAFYPTHLRAFASTVIITGSRAGIIISVQILNYMIEYNCEIGFNVFASIFASAAILAAFLPNNPSPRVQEELHLQD